MMALADIKNGMYRRRHRCRAKATTRSAWRRVVGRKGRVLAQDIVPEVARPAR